MTPLAMKVARDLTLPLKRRVFNSPAILALFNEDIHCFDITAIAKPIDGAMQEANVWPDVASMLPDLFLPSPVTLLEFARGGRRHAYVLRQDEGWLSMAVIQEEGAEPYGVSFGRFRPCSMLESPDRIKLEMPDAEIPEFTKPRPTTSALALTGAGHHSLDVFERALDAGELRASDPFLGEKTDSAYRQLQLVELDLEAKRKALRDARATQELIGAANHVIAFSVLAIDLINTPGVVGLKQHAPHVALAKRLALSGVGKYPLRGWSEVTVKTHTTFDDGDHESGPTFRKCLHFVRAHQRHYRTGHVAVVRAHWRGDPALGIKRTRYRVAA